MFLCPEPAGSVGFLPEPGYKGKQSFLITKNFFIIFYNFSIPPFDRHGAQVRSEPKQTRRKGLIL